MFLAWHHRMHSPPCPEALCLPAPASAPCLRPNRAPRAPQSPRQTLGQHSCATAFLPDTVCSQNRSKVLAGQITGGCDGEARCAEHRSHLRRTIKPVVAVPRCYCNQPCWEVFQAHPVRQNATRVEVAFKVRKNRSNKYVNFCFVYSPYFSLG